MKTTAQHTHPAAVVEDVELEDVVCWYDNAPADLSPGIAGWWTQLPLDYVDPVHVPTEENPFPVQARFATQNVPCPDPQESGLVEIGDRDELLVAGDAPHGPIT